MFGINAQLHPCFSGYEGCQSPVAASYIGYNITALLQFDTTFTAICRQIFVDLVYKATVIHVDRFHEHIKFLFHKSLRYAFFFVTGIHTSYCAFCGSGFR